MVANAALGGKSDAPASPGGKNLAEGYGSVEDAVAAINAAMSF